MEPYMIFLLGIGVALLLLVVVDFLFGEKW
jgi:hypothetical protein